MEDNSSSSSSAIVAIIAILAILAVAYVLFQNMKPVSDSTNKPVINLDLGGDSSAPSGGN